MPTRGDVQARSEVEAWQKRLLRPRARFKMLAFCYDLGFRDCWGFGSRRASAHASIRNRARMCSVLKHVLHWSSLVHCLQLSLYPTYIKPKTLCACALPHVVVAICRPASAAVFDVRRL